MASVECGMHQDQSTWSAKTSPIKKTRNMNGSPPSSTPASLPFPTHEKTSQITQSPPTWQLPIATLPRTRASPRYNKNKKKESKEHQRGQLSSRHSGRGGSRKVSCKHCKLHCCRNNHDSAITTARCHWKPTYKGYCLRWLCDEM